MPAGQTLICPSVNADASQKGYPLNWQDTTKDLQNSPRVEYGEGEMSFVDTMMRYFELQGFDVHRLTAEKIIPDLIQFDFDNVDETEFGEHMRSQLSVSSVPPFLESGESLMIRQYARRLIAQQWSNGESIRKKWNLP